MLILSAARLIELTSKWQLHLVRISGYFSDILPTFLLNVFNRWSRVNSAIYSRNIKPMMFNITTTLAKLAKLQLT